MNPRKVPFAVAGAAWAVLLFLHAPLAVLVAFSFNDSKFSVAWNGFTLQWYARLLEREDVLWALARSVGVGLGATMIATVLGTLFALAIARHRLPWRGMWEALLVVPVVTPEIVVGISLLLMFVGIGWPLGLGTILVAHVAFSISFVAIVVRARLEGMDRSLEEAALILGADEWTTFWRVTVPGLFPGILSGALLAFTMSFDDFVITSLVSGPGTGTLPIVVYAMVRKNVEPSINAISTIILVVTALLVWMSDRYTREAKATP